MSTVLIPVLFQNLIPVVLSSTQGICHKVCWPLLNDPANSNDTLCDSAQMSEERRRSIRFPKLVDGGGVAMKLSHQLGRLGVWFLCFRCDQEVRPLSFECLLNCFRLAHISFIPSLLLSQNYLFLNQPSNLVAGGDEGIDIFLNQFVKVLYRSRQWFGRCWRRWRCRRRSSTGTGSASRSYCSWSSIWKRRRSVN
jgi:hypothetical protein